MAFGWAVVWNAFDRGPARPAVTFFSGKKETHERKLPWSGDDPERSHGLASLALGSLIWVLVVMPLAGWFYRSFANSFKPCMFARPLRLPCGCLGGSSLSSCCSLSRRAGEGWGEGDPAPTPDEALGAQFLFFKPGPQGRLCRTAGAAAPRGQGATRSARPWGSSSPAKPEHRRVPVAKRRVADTRGRLCLVTLFGEANKVTCRRATPDPGTKNQTQRPKT